MNTLLKLLYPTILASFASPLLADLSKCPFSREKALVETAPCDNNETGLATNKLSLIWQKIEASRYTNLPEITGSSMAGGLNLLKPKFLSTTFNHAGDELPEGREKHIHKWGTSILVNWVPFPKHTYSGLFAEGSSNVLLRFSYAKPPQNDHSIPGMAIKVFIDNKPSVNLMAMNGLNEQQGLNIFENPFTNALPAPRWSLQSFLLSHSFASTLKMLGDKGSPLVLKTEHFASVKNNGSKVEHVHAPYKLIFKPTASAKALMENKTDDFRTVLAGQGKGLELYEIFAIDQERGGDHLDYIGSLFGASDFVASEYGDSKLFFQHYSPAAH